MRVLRGWEGEGCLVAWVEGEGDSIRGCWVKN